MLDAHCHLESFGDVEGVIAKCKPKLSALITCGYDMKSSETNLAIARANPNYVHACIGLAPQQALSIKEEKAHELFDLLMEAEGFVAVGEIGLDYKWAKGEPQRKLQERYFLRQLDLARELNLPVIIHSRDAERRCVDILEKEGVSKAMMHCYGGDEETARKAAGLGYFISISPFKSKEKKQVVKSVELDYLLCESDAPAVGKEPLASLESAQMIAEAKGVGVEEVGRATDNNCRKLLKI